MSITVTPFVSPKITDYDQASLEYKIIPGFLFCQEGSCALKCKGCCELIEVNCVYMYSNRMQTRFCLDCYDAKYNTKR